MRLERSQEFCKYCNLSFGLAEDRKRTEAGLVYHITCYGKLLMSKFKAIGGVVLH